MTSALLQKCREYEKTAGDAISAEERPVYHLSPRTGWTNDPNGFSCFGGKFHLFYQYNPYGTHWGPMHWGHAVSSDLLHWEYRPAAMAPDTEADCHGCFSGSAVETPEGKHLLMYTGVHPGENGDVQSQCIAVGDGREYEKFTGNPVLDGKDIPAGFSPADFRDPRIFREPEGGYGCVVACRSDDGSGSALLFRSDDGFAWQFSTILDRSANALGTMWECPDFFPLGDKQILMVNPQDMAPVGQELHCGDNSVFLVGSFERKPDAFSRETWQAVDQGLDFYAPQTLEAPDGRRILVGWLQSWDTAGRPPAGAKWFGQMTVPRELSWRDGRICQNPVAELKALWNHEVCHTNVTVTKEMTLPGVRGRVANLTVRIAAGAYRSASVTVAADTDHATVITYTPETSLLRLDRSRAGTNRDFAHVRECPVTFRDGALELQILLDRFSVEVFANGGERVMSCAIYTPQNADEIRFRADGTAKMDVTSYQLSADS